MDTNQYKDIPFEPRGRTGDGADCWGLLRIIYLTQYGIELPSYDDEYEDTEDAEALAKVVDGKEANLWCPVPHGHAKEGNAVLFKIMGHPCHVGVVLSRNRFIHTRRKIGVHIQRYDLNPWKYRVEGFYQYVGN